MVFLRLRRRFARLFIDTSTASVPNEPDLELELVDSSMRSFLCPVQYAEKYGPRPTKAPEPKEVDLPGTKVKESSDVGPERYGNEQENDNRDNRKSINKNSRVLKRSHRMPLCGLPRDAQGYWYFAAAEELPSYNLYQQLYGNPTTRPWGVKVFPNIPSPRDNEYPKCILYTPADMTADEEITTVYIATLGKLPKPGTYGSPRKYV